MLVCRLILLMGLLAATLAAQTTATNSAGTNPAAVQTTSTAGFFYLPLNVVTFGGGFLSPNAKFAYGSFSRYVGQGFYLTTAQEYSLVNKKIVSCTLAGSTKVLAQYRAITVLITGLGGGCTDGNAIGNAQGALDVRNGKTHSGEVFSVQKETAGGYKVTGGLRWAW